jgi:hypothetical protein
MNAVALSLSAVAAADLPPPVDEDLKDFDLESDSDVGANYLWLPGISIGGGFGQASMPYAPPFISNYDLKFRYNSVRLSILSLDLRYMMLDDLLLSAGFSNYFPAAGREFDAQVLNQLNIETELSLRKKLVLSPLLHMRASLAGHWRYERVSYPKGSFGLHGFPFQLGLELTRKLNYFDLPQALRISATSEFWRGANTAVKFNYAGTNVSPSGQQLTFVANQPATGLNYRAALTYSFAQRPGVFSSAGSEYQHHISLHWAQKSRGITGFLAESTPEGVLTGQQDVELNSTEWGLTWSERF